jgi:hypothetical protein
VAFSFITRFLGKTTSEAAGYGIGGAIRSPLEPPLQELTNKTWQAFVKSGVTIPTDPGDAAEIVAEDVALESWGADQVSQLGLGGDQFTKLVDAVRNGPGFGELLQTRRRGEITAAEFTHGLRKLRLEGLWDKALAALLDVLLTPADLANAVVQGHMTQSAAAAEAALQGVDAARFDILVQNTGLPPGPETLLAWKRRGIVTDAEFQTGILEGHTKPKYIPFYEKAAQPLLSAATGVRLYLKGWYTKAQRDALGSAHGYSSQQMEDWFLSEGRPATVHQIHIGYARGATLPGAANEHEAILTSVKQSDIRPEYADLLYAQRYSYPSAFVLRALVESGAVTAAEGEQALLFSGWEPGFAAKVAASWARTGTGTATDTHESKAQTQLWSTTHASYKANEISAATASTALGKAGVAAAAIPAVLAIWNEEKSLIRARLQASDIRKAYRKQDQNPKTSAAWTRAEAVAELLSLGWDNAGAEAYLNIG